MAYCEVEALRTGFLMHTNAGRRGDEFGVGGSWIWMELGNGFLVLGNEDHWSRGYRL